MKRTLYTFSLIFVAVLVNAQTTTENYIRTRTYTKDDASTYLEQIQYFDGLGRPVEIIQKGITPLGADLVSLTEYDGIGREEKQWLPIVIAGNAGAYVNPVSITGASPKSYYDNDTKPYTKILYEASPLNRVTDQYGAGETWHNNSKRVKTGYGTNNSSSEVMYFYPSNSTQLIKRGYYAVNTLYKTTITDEDGNPTIQYKDKLGQVIMKRAITIEAGNHDTYYVYNDLGQLSYVIPPIAVDSLPSNGNIDDNNGVLKRYSYLYKYDERGNNVVKRLPGCESIFMVYDKADRLLMSQDGNQRAKTPNKWTLNKYDNLGRLLYSSEISLAANHQELLDYFKNYVVTETFTVGSQPYPMSDTGYSRGWYHLVPCSLLTVNYYDNYDFLQKLSQSVQTNLAYTANNGYSTPHSSAKGLLTGTRTYILDGSGTYTTTALYYDYKGQIVQSRSTNHLGGYDFVYNAYDFTGHVTKNFKAHSSQNTAGQTAVNELYDYRYDHAGRLDTTIYTLDDKAPVVLAANTYDELGRLIVKLRHTGADREEFDYNIRNWLTRLKSGTFEEELNYNAGLPIGANACYNGNIAYSTWLYNGVKNGYAYNYDELNRLTWSQSFFNNQIMQDGDYNESFSYDKHGNIISLGRMKDANPIDHLWPMIYNGNQIQSIYDEYGSSGQYNTKEYNDNEKCPEIEFSYDPNGNMISDFDRNIVAIKYNLLNLPEVIQFKNGNQITNTYDASGQKLSTRYITAIKYITQPILSVGDLYDINYIVQHYNEVYIGGNDYIGNIEYLFLTEAYNGVYSSSTNYIKRVSNTEGFIDNLSYNNYYNYYRKDHLGNNREVWRAAYTKNGTTYLAKTIQRTQYYPSGLPWASNTYDYPDAQPYKYNGKEFVEMHGYDTYDYGARGYYPAIGRFTSVDPLAEKYYSVSPYVYCLNNPVKYIDPDGTSTWVMQNSDGTYRVVGGDYTDNDKNVYVYGINDGKLERGNSIGETTSNTSFYNSDANDGKGQWMGTIDLGDKSGKEFLNTIFNETPGLIDYMKNATGGKLFDFKRQGTTKGDANYANLNYFYRGMSILQKKDGMAMISSARDIGNIAAGYMAGVNGIPWGQVRLAFDILESYQGNLRGVEGLSTQNAERFGYNIGSSVNNNRIKTDLKIRAIIMYQILKSMF